jgi:5-enolpyruvylshikimate-3-phosphate synthase
MSLSLLAGYFPEIQIENPDCVLKSYPNFWENLRTVGVNISS